MNRPLPTMAETRLSENEDDRPGSDGEHRLQDACGTADRGPHVLRAAVDRSPQSRECGEFLGRMEMMFVASADGGGECDCSIRCGPPGFVHALDERHLAYPEYRGNGVMASLGNVSENAHVGLLFVDFFRDRVGLHVNGAARVVETPDLLAMPGPAGRLPRRRPRRQRPQAGAVGAGARARGVHPLLEAHPAAGESSTSKIAWGTDDARAKGGDYFGVTRDRAAAATADISAPALRATCRRHRRRLPRRRADGSGIPRRHPSPAQRTRSDVSRACAGTRAAAAGHSVRDTHEDCYGYNPRRLNLVRAVSASE